MPLPHVRTLTSATCHCRSAIAFPGLGGSPGSREAYIYREAEALLLPGASHELICHCRRGNEYEVGSVVKVGYREESWPADKPDAAYQVCRSRLR
jgi:hypothetical protein